MILCAGLILLGCAPPAEQGDDVRVRWEIDPDPPRVGPSTSTVSLVDSAGRPISGADITLEATMTHPGMQPSAARLEQVESGSYRGTVDLTMAGDWVLLLEATLPDGSTVRRERAVRGVRTE